MVSIRLTDGSGSRFGCQRLREVVRNTIEPDWFILHQEASVPAAFTVRLDEKTLDALDRLAEKTERSRSWLVTQAVETYVELNAWQLEKIEAGLRAADRGEFASEQEVQKVRTKFSRKA
jgi:predicted transcriptional regulator